MPSRLATQSSSRAVSLLGHPSLQSRCTAPGPAATKAETSAKPGSSGCSPAGAVVAAPLSWLEVLADDPTASGRPTPATAAVL